MLSSKPIWRPGASFSLSGCSAVEHKSCQCYPCNWTLKGTLEELCLVMKFSLSGRARAISVLRGKSSYEASPLPEATWGIFPGGYLTYKGSREMGNSFQILLIGLLPEKVTVFSLPCKQQIFNDGSLYSHLNASGTSLRSGGWIVRSRALQWWWKCHGWARICDD